MVKHKLADTILRLGWEFNGGWFTWRASGTEKTEFPLAAARFKDLFGARPPANAEQAGPGGAGGITDQEKQ